MLFRTILCFVILNLYIPSAAEASSVYINGVLVVTKEIKHNYSEDESIPTALRTETIAKAMENRQKIDIKAHHPSIGPEDAPVTIVEFMDLSCIYCQETSKKIDLARQAHKENVRHVFIYLPFDPYNITNPASFYGRIADHNGLFWQYRKNLYDIKGSEDLVFIDQLLASGLSEKSIRNSARAHARRYYNELDEDAQYAARLGLTTPPYVFINGVMIGGSIPFDAMNEFITYEIDQYHLRQ